MPNQEIHSFTELTTPADDDEYPVVDRDDTTDDTDGTTKRIQASNMVAKKIKTTTGPTVLSIGAVADGEFLKRSGSGIISGVPTGTGIGGSTGATDNAVLRADGTGGSTVQSSVVSVDDNGAVTVPEIAAPSTPASGKVILYAKSDGLLYSKDDAGTESAVSGGAGASALDDLSDVTITSPSTDDVLKYNGSAWVNGDAPSGSGLFPSGAFETYRLIGVNSRPNSTSVDTYGHAAVTAYADVSTNADDADGPFTRRDTAASSGTTAGMDFNNGGLIQTRWLPKIIVKLKTGSDVTSQRLWVGSLSVGAGSFTDDPTANGFAFTFSTNASDTNWMTWTNDNSGGGLRQSSGVAYSADTCYLLGFDIENTSSIKFYISTDNGVTFTLVNTHATNLPASSTAMNFYYDLRTLTGAVRSTKHSFTHIRMR